ncbi:hypothetical protein BDR06DRAFT_1015526 [Suillus hirtellus]|nr:hypothetical protein BDR06DRAFT_1015526 [Suillus hirtellus]
MECRRHKSNQRCCVCKADSDHDPSQVPAPSGKQDTHALPTSITRPSAPVPRALPHQQRSISVNKRTIDHLSNSSDPFAKAYEQAKKLRTDRLDEEMKRVERMRKALDKMKDRGCPPCIAFDDQGGRSGHPMWRCPSLERLGMTWDDYRDWKTSIKYHNHKGICWKCHVPTCGDELHRPLEKGITVCDWPDVVLPLALTVFQQAQVREAAQRHFGVVWVKMDKFQNWLTKAPGAGHHSKGMDLLLWPNCPREWIVNGWLYAYHGKICIDRWCSSGVDGHAHISSKSKIQDCPAGSLTGSLDKYADGATILHGELYGLVMSTLLARPHPASLVVCAACAHIISVATLHHLDLSPALLHVKADTNLSSFPAPGNALVDAIARHFGPFRMLLSSEFYPSLDWVLKPLKSISGGSCDALEMHKLCVEAAYARTVEASRFRVHEFDQESEAFVVMGRVWLCQAALVRVSGRSAQKGTDPQSVLRSSLEAWDGGDRREEEKTRPNHTWSMARVESLSEAPDPDTT